MRVPTGVSFRADQYPSLDMGQLQSRLEKLVLCAKSKKKQHLLTFKGDTTMPKLIATHEVNDVAHWLSSKKREEVFSGVAQNIRTFVQSNDSNRVGLSMDVLDMDAFQAVMQSEAGAAAMKHDGVRAETLVVLFEK